MADKKDVTWEDIEARVIQPALKIAEDTSLGEEEKERAWAEQGLGGKSFYGLAKACVNTYTFILSNMYPNIISNACSPGWIETDLTRPYLGSIGKTAKDIGMLPVEKGTVSPIHLLMDTLEGNGRYYGSDGKRSPMHRSRDPGDPEYDGTFP